MYGEQYIYSMLYVQTTELSVEILFLEVRLRCSYYLGE